jgi:DNA helicase-2/ATP-dependent DNA helicase PcrA
MQAIFKRKASSGCSPSADWGDLSKAAGAFEELDFPHRWSSGCQQLGNWTLNARKTLKSGGKIDLTNGIPPSVTIVVAENVATESRRIT